MSISQRIYVEFLKEIKRRKKSKDYGSYSQKTSSKRPIITGKRKMSNRHGAY
jgi:hypothetical protein